MERANAIVPLSSDANYKAGYSNDFPAVAAEINRSVTGSPGRVTGRGSNSLVLAGALRLRRQFASR